MPDCSKRTLPQISDETASQCFSSMALTPQVFYTASLTSRWVWGLKNVLRDAASLGYRSSFRIDWPSLFIDTDHCVLVTCVTIALQEATLRCPGLSTSYSTPVSGINSGNPDCGWLAARFTL